MRTAILLSLCFMLAACGFRPVHGRDYREEQQIDLAALEVVVNRSRAGQLLEAEIKDGINPDYQRADKRYRLEIQFTEMDIPLFINPDGTSSRGDILLTSTYMLKRIADNVVVTKGRLQRTSSYNTSDAADYASFVSITDAKKRGIIELAQDYKLRMANLLARQN